MIHHPRPIITLTTDFGRDSAYVAQMKGVILSRNSDVQLVDITHEVPPQDVRGGAIILDDVCRWFPPRTIHIAVVDPGVGTSRQMVYAKIGAHRYLAPDNGLLTLVAQRTPPELVVSLVNPLYFLPEVTATFHGRDMLSPVAAHLSLGLNPERLGERRSALHQLPFPRVVVEDRRITGVVIQVDPFGNVITNIDRHEMQAVAELSAARVHCCGHQIDHVVRTYGERPPGSLVALIGSNGRLEVASVNGSAAALIGAAIGDTVVVEW